MTKAAWIAVDWGTSNLRLWAMGADNTVLAEATSDRGMSSLSAADYEGVLLDLCGGWLGDGVTSVLVAGMAGARQGWIEAPYGSVPCPPVGSSAVTAPNHDPRLDVRIVPGLCQTSPADVMRGEEVQIAGYLATNPDYDGIICLPGTHSKWVEVSAGEVVSFRTFMTGELFALLSGQSVLRHTVGGGWDETAFGIAVTEALSYPETLARNLFGLRAESLLADLCKAEATSRLSGILIGAELAAARPYWLGRPVTVIGAPKLAGIYATALRLQGLAPERADVTKMTLAGIIAARGAPATTAPTLH